MCEYMCLILHTSKWNLNISGNKLCQLSLVYRCSNESNFLHRLVYFLLTEREGRTGEITTRGLALIGRTKRNKVPSKLG